MDEQICWRCIYATGGCSWSDKLKPVSGWDATKITKCGMETYQIKSCPQFERGRRKEKSKKKESEELRVIKYTPEQKAEVIRLYNYGAKQSEIARRTGVNKKTVWHWIAKSKKEEPAAMAVATSPKKCEDNTNDIIPEKEGKVKYTKPEIISAPPLPEPKQDSKSKSNKNNVIAKIDKAGKQLMDLYEYMTPQEQRAFDLGEIYRLIIEALNAAEEDTGYDK